VSTTEQAPVRDARVQSAIDHWAPRFVQAGVDYNDFVRTTAGVERWDDWIDAWAELGDRHAELAREAEAAGRTVTAGDAWPRASVAYHFGKFVWVLDENRVRPVHQKSVDALYAGHRALGNAVERIEAPLDGKAMVGNLRRPVGLDRPPLVLLIPGLDSTKEELLGMEEAFLRRGMATFALDSPGQGECTYELPLRYDYEVAVTSALDVLAGRDDVDLDRVGMVGQSMGGYFAPRAAAFEPRVKAVVGLSGAYKRVDIWDSLPPVNRETFIYKTHSRDAEEARGRAGDGPRGRAREARPPGAVRDRDARRAGALAADRDAGQGRATGRVRARRGRHARAVELPLPAAAAGVRLDGGEAGLIGPICAPAHFVTGVTNAGGAGWDSGDSVPRPSPGATMYAANSYVIRLATDADAQALQRLAELDAQPPLEGSIIIGELHGEPVAALALADDRTVADPFRPTAHLLATMRVRAQGLRAVERTPSLRERMIAGVPATYRAATRRA